MRSKYNIWFQDYFSINSNGHNKISYGQKIYIQILIEFLDVFGGSEQE